MKSISISMTAFSVLLFGSLLQAATYDCNISSETGVVYSFELDSVKRSQGYSDRIAQLGVNCSLEEEAPGDYSILYCKISQYGDVVAESAADIKESFVLGATIENNGSSQPLRYGVTCIKGQ